MQYLPIPGSHAEWRALVGAREIGAPLPKPRLRLPAAIKRRLARLSPAARIAVVEGRASLYRRRPFVTGQGHPFLRVGH